MNEIDQEIKETAKEIEVLSTGYRNKYYLTMGLGLQMISKLSDLGHNNEANYFIQKLQDIKDGGNHE